MDWNEIKAWRKATRERLLAARTALLQGERQALFAQVEAGLRRLLPPAKGQRVAFCWPFKAEFDARSLVRHLLAEGAEACLPVVVEKAQPLEFWRWQPGAPLKRGVWDIPIPAERDPVLPTLAFVPLVGFDQAGYRLGYGGGYFDRTLASLPERPFSIGVGLELGRLASIHPQPFDIPMHAIATEAGAWRVEQGRLVAV